MKIEVSSEELNDIVTALRSKAAGDRQAASAAVTDNPTTPGINSLADTLIRQADRQEKLANRIEE